MVAGSCQFVPKAELFLPVALVKKPGATLAGSNRRYFRSLSCLCAISVLPESCILFGVNPVYFEVCVGICRFSCSSVFLS